MEEHQTSIDDLRTVFESEQDFNDLLNGDRDITLKQIQTLAKIFQVSPTVFIEASVPTNI